MGFFKYITETTHLASLITAFSLSGRCRYYKDNKPKQPSITSIPSNSVVALLTRVGIGDLVSLVGIQPDLLLATAQDAGGQPLLEPEHATQHS